MPPRRMKRQAKRKTARKGLKRAAPRLYKAVKAVAKNEALKAQETKIVYAQLPPIQVTNTLFSKFNPGAMQFLQPVIPVLQGGTNSAQLIGKQVTLVNGFIRFHFNLVRGNNVNTDIILKLFCLKSRMVKNYNSSVNGLPGSDLLRPGDNNLNDFDPAGLSVAARLLAQQNINNLNWTGKVHTFTFRKNAGQQNFDSQATPAPPQGSEEVPNLSANQNYHDFVWNWTDGHKVLKYDTQANALPNNYAPFWGVCAYFPDGTPYYLNPSGATGTQNMPIEVTATSYMYYKDG